MTNIRLAKLAVGTATMVAAALLVPVTNAQALPPCCSVETITTYYTDAARTTVSGMKYAGDCNNFETGTETAYFSVRNIFC